MFPHIRTAVPITFNRAASVVVRVFTLGRLYPKYARSSLVEGGRSIEKLIKVNGREGMRMKE
jgi:hypothetical protein